MSRSEILVGVGPGSFTGLRVGIAAAHGMAIGWSVPLSGMNSLALLAASAPPGEGKVAAAMAGGHGELFVQTFNRKKLTATGPILNLTPDSGGAQGRRAAGCRQRRRSAGRGAARSGEALPLFPTASRALALARAAADAGMQADLCPRARRAPEGAA